VAEVEGWAQASVQRIRPNGGKSGTCVVYGLPRDSIFVNPPILSGEWLQAPERIGQNEVVVTAEWIADEAEVQVGDVITLDLNGEEKAWNVVGVLISAAPAVYANYADVTHFLKQPNKTSLMLVRTVDRDTAFVADVRNDLLEFLDLR